MTNYLKTLNLKKVEHPYVAPQVQDAETIERETKKENDEFSDLYKRFNEVNDVATQQKKDKEIIGLIDDIKDEDNPFKNTFKTKPEDIFIDDDAFDDFDQNDKKRFLMIFCRMKI